jgi:hypothetical protein
MRAERSDALFLVGLSGYNILSAQAWRQLQAEHGRAGLVSGMWALYGQGPGDG